jgi:hypothetical protein
MVDLTREGIPPRRPSAGLCRICATCAEFVPNYVVTSEYSRACAFSEFNSQNTRKRLQELRRA